MKPLTPEELIHHFQSQKPQPDWSFAAYKPSETGKWTHSYHRYPAKFIPQLVEKLFETYLTSETAHINDPFVGSGTTIATAIWRGFQASGTDVNGIAHLMTTVKATPIEPAYLADRLAPFFNRLQAWQEQQRLLFQDDLPPLIPQQHEERIDYWFSEENKFKLGKIRRLINQQQEVTIRHFLLVGFSHILKNCAIWAQGSTKPTRNFKKQPADPYTVLPRHLRKMSRGNQAFYDVVPTKVKQNPTAYLNVRLGDARQQPVADNSVDLIVSSSPYVTSYEYADLHQLSTIWLDLADDLGTYRREFIGTAYKSYEEATSRLPGQIARQLVMQMAAQSNKMAQEIAAFFEDMQGVFAESYRILKPGGRCCFVIGNTKLKGVAILNAEAFAEGLMLAGFHFDRVIVREIPSKILPQKRDEKTGRFAKSDAADAQAYPLEYIVIGIK